MCACFSSEPCSQSQTAMNTLGNITKKWWLIRWLNEWLQKVSKSHVTHVEYVASHVIYKTLQKLLCGVFWAFKYRVCRLLLLEFVDIVNSSTAFPKGSKDFRRLRSLFVQAVCKTAQLLNQFHRQKLLSKFMVANVGRRVSLRTTPIVIVHTSHSFWGHCIIRVHRCVSLTDHANGCTIATPTTFSPPHRLLWPPKTVAALWYLNLRRLCELAESLKTSKKLTSRVRIFKSLVIVESWWLKYQRHAPLWRVRRAEDREPSAQLISMHSELNIIYWLPIK